MRNNNFFVVLISALYILKCTVLLEDSLSFPQVTSNSTQNEFNNENITNIESMGLPQLQTYQTQNESNQHVAIQDFSNSKVI